MKVNDHISRQAIGGTRAPKIKGEVILRLINAKTGAVEKEVKGANMATNAIRDIFASNYAGCINYAQILPIATKLLGGIVCFESTLTADAAEYYPPTGNNNKVVAHAGQTTYASTTDDTTRGLPNNNMSGPISGGYKLVFDFPVTQGNGTISALGLTHTDTGDRWLFGGANYTPVQKFSYPGDRIFAPITATAGTLAPSIEDRSNKITYLLKYSASDATKLTITEILNSGLIEHIGLNQRGTFDNFTANGVTEINHEVTLPHYATRGVFIHFETARELHYIYVNGNTLEKTIISLVNFTTSTTTATISGASMAEYTSNNPQQIQACRILSLDKNGYMYVAASSGNKVYKIKYSDTTQVNEITASFTLTGGAYGISGAGNHAIAMQGNFIVDGNTIRQCDTPLMPSSEWSYIMTNTAWKETPVMVPTISRPYDNTPQGYSTALIKLYLGTIYNLSEPVIKTAAQAMQIEYNITEVDPNAEQEAET